jgi:hypothetical protein
LFVVCDRTGQTRSSKPYGGDRRVQWVLRLHINRKVKTLDVAENMVDWEIAEDGLYVATRDFLIRRGYCCANRCRNCPYINWRQRRDWQPLPIECIRRRCVKPKVIAGARELLYLHEQQLQQCQTKERDYHRGMIAHYRRLLETWGNC